MRAYDEARRAVSRVDRSGPATACARRTETAQACPRRAAKDAAGLECEPDQRDLHRYVYPEQYLLDRVVTLLRVDRVLHVRWPNQDEQRGCGETRPSSTGPRGLRRR